MPNCICSVCKEATHNMDCLKIREEMVCLACVSKQLSELKETNIALRNALKTASGRLRKLVENVGFVPTEAREHYYKSRAISIRDDLRIVLKDTNEIYTNEI